MFSTVFRTAILYLAVTLAVRLMGKRQIGDMQPNELVITLLISEIAAIPLQDSNQPVLNGVAAIAVLVILEIFVSVLVMKSAFFRRIMNGTAVIVINNGVIDISAMKKLRITVLDLVELLRTKDVFNIEDVAFAVLEVNGELSVLLKKQSSPPSAKDLNIKTEKDSLSLPAVTDGKPIKETLKSLNIKKADLIKKASPKKLKNIFLMTADTDGNCKVISRKE